MTTPVASVGRVRIPPLRSGRPAEVLTRLITAAIQRSRGEIIALVPEFAKLNRSHNSPFHKYAIDEHTFEFIGYLTRDPLVSELLTGEIIIAALLHDIGKPASETTTPDGRSQYLKHDQIGARDIAPAILTNLQIAEADESRLIIIKLIEHHMAPVSLISQAADGALTDKALGRFIRDVAEPLAKAGVSLELLLAFGRADLLASQGPECYKRLGVAENNEAALAEKIGQTIRSIKDEVRLYYDKQQAAQASVPKTINGGTLIAAGFKPGPALKGILARAAELEREGLIGKTLVARLRVEFTQNLA